MVSADCFLPMLAALSFAFAASDTLPCPFTRRVIQPLRVRAVRPSGPMVSLVLVKRATRPAEPSVLFAFAVRAWRLAAPMVSIALRAASDRPAFPRVRFALMIRSEQPPGPRVAMALYMRADLASALRVAKNAFAAAVSQPSPPFLMLRFARPNALKWAIQCISTLRMMFLRASSSSGRSGTSIIKRICGGCPSRLIFLHQFAE